tara:strand:- start:701 stop:1063 length:363 start_codon:yes stop_codon:yes gene_type:complete
MLSNIIDRFEICLKAEIKILNKYYELYGSDKDGMTYAQDKEIQFQKGIIANWKCVIKKLNKIQKQAITQDEIIDLMVHNELTIKNVVDSAIWYNKLIGVGLIRLGDDLQDYCYNKIEGAK